MGKFIQCYWWGAIVPFSPTFIIIPVQWTFTFSFCQGSHNIQLTNWILLYSINKNLHLRLTKDFQIVEKISPAIRCRNMQKYNIFTWIERTNNLVMIFREVWDFIWDWIRILSLQNRHHCAGGPQTFHKYTASSSRPSILLYVSPYCTYEWSSVKI